MYTLAPGEARVPAPHIFDTFNTEQKSTRIKVRVDNDSHSLRKWLARVETLHRGSVAYILETRKFWDVAGHQCRQLRNVLTCCTLDTSRGRPDIECSFH